MDYFNSVYPITFLPDAIGPKSIRSNLVNREIPTVYDVAVGDGF